MAYVIVTTDDGRTVERIQIPHDMSPSAVGRRLTGRNQSVLGWLQRALSDAQIIQAGGDPERPSEKAMRMLMEKPWVIRPAEYDGMGGTLARFATDTEAEAWMAEAYPHRNPVTYYTPSKDERYIENIQARR